MNLKLTKQYQHRHYHPHLEIKFPLRRLQKHHHLHHPRRLRRDYVQRRHRYFLEKGLLKAYCLNLREQSEDW
jgi:hypothetical protein